jgi:hypothetical protein
MSLKDVTDLLPCEVARACFERAYTLAVRANLPPAGVPFFDPATGEPWAGPENVRELVVQQLDAELAKVLGAEFCGVDLARLVEVAA